MRRPYPDEQLPVAGSQNGAEAGQSSAVVHSTQV